MSETEVDSTNSMSSEHPLCYDDESIYSIVSSTMDELT